MNETKYYVDDPHAPVPQKYHMGAVAIIVHENGSLLFDERVDCNQFSLIGGVVELNESIVTALYREIKEEIGIVADNHQFFGIFSNPSRIIAYPDGFVFRPITSAFIVNITEEQYKNIVISHEAKVFACLTKKIFLVLILLLHIAKL